MTTLAIIPLLLCASTVLEEPWPPDIL
jgi:hypothetical protein